MIAGGPAQHGGVVAAGDVAAILGVRLVRRLGRGPGPLDFGGRLGGGGTVVPFKRLLVSGNRGAAPAGGSLVCGFDLAADVVGHHVLPAACPRVPACGRVGLRLRAGGVGVPQGGAAAGRGPGGRW